MKLINVIKTRFKSIDFVYVILAFAVINSFIINVIVPWRNEFFILASQMLKGKLYLPEAVGDAVLYNGKYYWHLGPLPSILLIPVSLLSNYVKSDFLNPGVVNFLFVLLLLYLGYKISIKFNLSKKDSMWISLALIFGSIFIVSAYAPWSWYFSHTVCFLLGLLSINEFLSHRRPFLLGFFHSMMFLTRVTAGFGFIFYLINFIFSKEELKKKIKNIIYLIIPIIFSGFILLYYNYIRFDNPFNNGYKMSDNWVENYQNQKYELINYGLFKVGNIPTNIYYYFFSIPSPVLERIENFDRGLYKSDRSLIFHLKPPYIKVSPPGVSFFVVSPIFLLIFKNKMKNKYSIYSVITSLVILFILLTYYWVGWTQVGPRYMIDLLPFIFIVFLDTLSDRPVPMKYKVVILFSVLFNTYLFFTVY